MKIDELILNKEIQTWRVYYLKEIILRNPILKLINVDDRNKLKNMFMSIPTDQFTNPDETWNKCINYLIYTKIKDEL